MKAMKTRSPHSPAVAETSAPPPSSSLSTRAKRAISALLALHLVALIAAPLSVPPSSDLFRGLAGSLSWYIDPLFLNHGYRFFAPDPGPGDTMRCHIELADGTVLEKTFPDLQQQRPRLLYHRHFMLSSRLQGGPADPTARAYAQSYARHLAERYDARYVRIDQVRHLLPRPDQVLQGLQLTDASLYETPIDPRPDGLWSTDLPVELAGERTSGPVGPIAHAVSGGAAGPSAAIDGEEIAPPQAEGATVTKPATAPASSNSSASPGGGIPWRPEESTTARLTLQLVSGEPTRESPPQGTAVLRGLPGGPAAVSFAWVEEQPLRLTLRSVDPRAPTLSLMRIGPEEMMLTIPRPQGPPLQAVMTRASAPLAEVRREVE